MHPNQHAAIAEELARDIASLRSQIEEMETVYRFHKRHSEDPFAGLFDDSVDGAQSNGSRSNGDDSDDDKPSYADSIKAVMLVTGREMRVPELCRALANLQGEKTDKVFNAIVYSAMRRRPDLFKKSGRYWDLVSRK